MTEEQIENRPELPVNWFSGDRPENPNWEMPQGTPPEMHSGDMQWMPWGMPENMPWSQSNSNITHNGVNTFSKDDTLSNQEISSKWDSEHAVLVSGGNVVISDSVITKSGDADGDNADFYGTNAAVIAVDWKLELNNVSVNSDWAHANAVFAYWDGEIIISNSVITTKDNNSWWIMVTWWGKLTANNLTVTTEWNSSAAIRSDRWGGEIYVNWWLYTTNGVWSPAIYSTANIVVEDAVLVATKSEWAIVEWKNSISIVNSTLTDSNTTLNGQSTTYKNIFLYQSMSGDADEWTAKFTAINSKIITNKWDTIYVTNTSADIYLESNEIINYDWDFLRIEAAAWWNEGHNWWNVNLNLVNQKVEWDILVDDISTLNIEMTEWSQLIWAINSSNTSKNISINMDGTSTWTLNADSYISELQSSTDDYANINLNWYTLYIWDEIITSTSYQETSETSTTTLTTDSESHYSTSNIIWWWVSTIAIIAILYILIRKLFRKK